MGTRRGRIGVEGFALAVAAAFCGAPTFEAVAQAVEEPAASAPEEIVVTGARRRVEDVQDVPNSITVLDQEAISAADITSIQELQYYVPSLNVQAQGNDYNYPPISMRGQGTYSPGATPAVASYINEVPTGSTANAGDLSGGRFYDLQSVQALKGPQGTLFGRNTTGGAILFESARPTEDFEGFIEGTVGSFEQRDVAFALNLPLNDMFQFRLAGQRLQRDGYAHVESTPSHPDGLDMGNRDIESVRGTLRFSPTSTIRNDLILETHSQNTNGFPLVLAAVNPTTESGFLEFIYPGIEALVAEQQARGPYDLIPISVDPMTRLRFQGATDIFEWTISPTLKFRNIASYGETEFSFQQDVDATIFDLLDAPDRSVVPSVREQVTEEAQLQGEAFDGQLDWIFGAFYLNDETADYGISRSTVFSGTGFSSSAIGSESRALYTQGTYDLSSLLEGLSFTAGYRYTWDTRSYSSREIDQTTGEPVLDGSGEEIITSVPDAEFEAPSWTLSLDYRASDSLLFYLASRRGYRSGGFNPGASDPARREFGPEFLTDVEFGAKSDWSLPGARRARANFAFYYGWYEDIQLTQLIAEPTGVEAIVSNAGEANVYGAELEGFVDLTSRLTLTLASSWYYENFTELLPDVDPAVAEYFPKYVPAYQVNVGLQYEAPIPATAGELTFGANWTWFSDISSSLEFIPQPFDTIPAYGLLNLNADWNHVLGSDVDASLFVTNALDETHLSGSIPFYYGVGLTTATYTLPRAAGVRLRYAF